MLKGLINLPTEEEMLEITKRNYEVNKENPNNFSYWFGPLSNVLKGEFLIPKSACIELPFKMKDDLQQDSMRVPDEVKQEFADLVLQNKDVQSLKAKTLFMKTGVFSNKFDFNNSCKLTSTDKLFEQFYAILYTAAVYSANHTNEIVLREYIHDFHNHATIYNGMPLRTEFRVFYDFDSDKVLGIANYWHPEEMKRALTPYVVRGVFTHITDVEQQRVISKQVIAHEQKDYIKKAFNDYFNYLDSMDRINQEFNSMKGYIANKVAKALNGTNALPGAWSIDIMKNGSEFYFIDAAVMEQSALVNRMEVVK